MAEDRPRPEQSPKAGGSALLPLELPHFAARGLAWLLLAGFVIAVVAVNVVRISDTVSCPFVLVQQTGTDQVAAPAGFELGEVRVSEGSEVLQGDPLCTLRPVAGGSDWRTLRAPFDGTVVMVAGKNAGDPLAEGEKLFRIVPAASPLRARLVVPDGRLGDVRSGQQVLLSFDAFPAHTFGAQPARLGWVSPVKEEGDAQEGYRALADLGRSTVDRRGERVALRAGMRGEARIILGERLLVDFVFAPLARARDQLSPAAPARP